MRIDPKFHKLMNLTQSDNDNEALAALRKANSMLKHSKLTWKDILDEAEKFEKLRIQYNDLVRRYNRNVMRGL
jgi:hypothetical protein